MQAAAPGCSRRRLWLLAGIILLGAFLRLHRLTELPPGIDYDPAYYGVDALGILRGEFPVYLTTNFGREPMFSYIVALLYAIVGVGGFGIHLASAFVGIMTIPATFLVAHEFFHYERAALKSYGGLLAALLLSISYWHLNWSRVGVRAVLVPLFVAVTLFFAWRGLRVSRRRDFVRAGFFLGAGLYTYQAARLMPPLLVVIVIVTLWRRRTFSKEIAVNLALLALAALLVFAPLGYFALNNPGALTRRMQDIVLIDSNQPAGEQIGDLLVHAISGLQMLSFKGHSDPQFTIPGRPALNPFLSSFFYVGLLVSLRRFRIQRYLGLLAWLAILLAPALVADQASPAKRAIGILPAVMMLITLAIITIAEWLSRRSRRVEKVGERGGPPVDGRRRVLHLFLLLLAAGLFYTGANAYRDYFLVWGADPDLPGHFQDDRAEVGMFIGRQSPDKRFYLSPLSPAHPAIQLYAPDQNIQGYNGRFCAVFPARPTTDTLYVIVPDNREQSLEQLVARFPQGDVVAEKAHPRRQEPYYIAYEVPAGVSPVIGPAFLHEANWNGKIRLLGYDLPPAPYAPGQSLEVTLYYQALDKIRRNYTAFVHVLGDVNPASGNPIWAQTDSEPCQGGYQTAAWHQDELIVDRIPLFIPEETASGIYRLALGFYTWPDLERLSLVDGGDSVLLVQPFLVE